MINKSYLYHFVLRLGIDSENYFLSKLKTDYSDIFPDTHITRYNIRRKNLANKITLLTERLSDDLTFGEDCFIVDSMPVPVCKKQIINQLITLNTL